jgi:hypothetical protein
MPKLSKQYLSLGLLLLINWYQEINGIILIILKDIKVPNVKQNTATAKATSDNMFGKMFGKQGS